MIHNSEIGICKENMQTGRLRVSDFFTRNSVEVSNPEYQLVCATVRKLVCRYQPVLPSDPAG
jgi:hypothetical protein